MNNKIGINLMLWSDELSTSLFPTVERLKMIGYELVELPMFSPEPERMKVWNQFLNDLGMRRTASTALNPDEHLISADPSIRRQGIDKMKKLLDAAKIAGCELMIGPIHSALGVFSGKPATEDEWKRGIESVREIAEHAGQCQIKIALESVSRFECYLLNSVLDGHRFAQEVNHPACGTMYDTFHAHIEDKSPKKALETIKSSLIHVHLSENDRSTPGKGQVAWNETFNALQSIGYSGYLVVEAFGGALEKIAAATKIWRKMFDSEEQLASDAFAFIQDNLRQRNS